MPIIAIRTATLDDLDALYDICLRTGDAGQDATGQLVHPELYGHLWAGAYPHHSPDHAVVATRDGRVVGYVLAAVDTAAFEETLERDWWPALRERYPLPGAGTDLDRRLTAQLHAAERTPATLLAAYPSHLHIDLLPEAQGHGVGRRLMDECFRRLVAAGSVGVHLGVAPANARAQGFYEHLGMRRHDTDEGIVLYTRRLA